MRLCLRLWSGLCTVFWKTVFQGLFSKECVPRTFSKDCVSRTMFQGSCSVYCSNQYMTICWSIYFPSIVYFLSFYCLSIAYQLSIYCLSIVYPFSAYCLSLSIAYLYLFPIYVLSMKSNLQTFGLVESLSSYTFSVIMLKKCC